MAEKLLEDMSPEEFEQVMEDFITREQAEVSLSTFPRPRGGGAKSLFSEHYLRHRLPEHPEWGDDVGEPLAALRAEWETSMGKLRPLLACLAATDRLIDLIVYRLYGLTEDEVAVAEGKHE